MAEYIEREAVLALKQKIGAYGMDISSQEVILIPTADVAPVHHGRWIMPLLMADGHIHAECNHCHKIRIIDDYCSACGAVMDLEDTED